jgi:hypothetical protein
MTIRLLRLLLMPWLWCRESQQLLMASSMSMDDVWWQHRVSPTAVSKMILDCGTMFFGSDMGRAYPLLAQLATVLVMSTTSRG